MPMQIQLANKLLWKKLFEGAALLSLAAGYKTQIPPYSPTTHRRVAGFEIVIQARCGLAVLVLHLD